MSNLPPLPPVPTSGEKTVAQIEQLPAIMAQLQKSVEQVVVGQNATVEAILIALITRGHCLLTGVPGLAKTLLVKVVAHLLGLHFSRVQFTPDLMPSDIVGTDILEEDTETGHRKFVFVPGPSSRRSCWRMKLTARRRRPRPLCWRRCRKRR
jgi:MoxR-like ATPase